MDTRLTVTGTRISEITVCLLWYAAFARRDVGVVLDVNLNFTFHVTVHRNRFLCNNQKPKQNVICNEHYYKAPGKFSCSEMLDRLSDYVDASTRVAKGSQNTYHCCGCKETSHGRQQCEHTLFRSFPHRAFLYLITSFYPKSTHIIC